MSTFFECVVSVGLFIIIGAAGSTDLNTISLTQTILYVLMGIGITMVGLFGCKTTKRRQGK